MSVAIDIYTSKDGLLFYENGKIYGAISDDNEETLQLIITKVTLLELMLGYNKGSLLQQLDWLLMESL